VAAKMHHRNDQNIIPFESVNDSIRKAVGPTASNLLVQCEPCLRMNKNAPDGSPDFLEKIKSKSRNAVLVIFRGFPEFPRRRRQKPELHRFNSSSMACKASSPLTALS
jgi:hypothetical protein